MILSEITPERFDALLPTRGIRIETGPFAFRITSSLPELAAPLRLLYADFPAAQEGFIDFHLVLRPSGLLGLARGSQKSSSTATECSGLSLGAPRYRTRNGP